ncbi:MAG: AzlC family protein [Chloroflexi bacterium]|jgi:4-azaleucine resistance transporter AzlC|nr:AzlC family protein [Chloroflexota bacterium]
MIVTPKKEFLSGIRAEAPILVGVIPFGMIYGVLALSAGIPASAAQAMSAIVFAGSSQILVTQLVHQLAPSIVIILTVGVVNLRHALYSASVAPYVNKLRPLWKWILAYLLTDEAYAVTILHYQKEEGEEKEVPENNKHWFFLGAGLALWSSWQLSTAAGILLGAVVPASWSLDFTLALTFIALVVPALKDKATLAAALSAGIVAVFSFRFPYKLGLMLAALIGILVGIILEDLARKRTRQAS